MQNVITSSKFVVKDSAAGNAEGDKHNIEGGNDLVVVKVLHGLVHVHNLDKACASHKEKHNVQLPVCKLGDKSLGSECIPAIMKVDSLKKREAKQKKRVKEK